MQNQPLESILSARDGAMLFRRSWPVPHPRGTIVLIHGIAEHSGRYLLVADQLNAWGWRVEAYDQRGHGCSEGPRGGLVRDDDLVEDLAALVAEVRRTHPGGPLLLLGHSMGGLVAGCYVADLLTPSLAALRTPVDALIMMSPALDVSGSVPLSGRLAMASVGRLVPDVRVRTGFDPGAICRDPAVVEAYRHDPLVHDLVSTRLGRFIIDGGRRLRALAPRWRMPTLLLYGGADRIVRPQGCAAFAEAAPATVRSRCFMEMAHELHNEPDRAQVFEAMGQGLYWLCTQIDGAPAQAYLARGKADAA